MTAQLYQTASELLRAVTLLAADVKYLKLFQNPAALTKGFDPAILTEANFSGYAPIDISATWGAAAIDSNGNGTCINTLQTFTKSGATPNAAVYGFSYWDATGLICLWAQTFADGPYPMAIDGDVIRITPLISVSGPIFP